MFELLIHKPFGFLLDVLYQFTNNYGVALILFAIVVKTILFPITAKSKKSTMKMSRVTPRIKAIQAKYANDQQKQSEAIQALYKEEGIGVTGGCLWSLVPLLILIPLYQVVRQPLVYMLNQTAEEAAIIVEIIKKGLPDLFNTKNSFYAEIISAAHISEFTAAIKEALPNATEKLLAGINFNFFNIDLGAIPSFTDFKFDWAHIGPMTLPVLSAGSQVLNIFIMNQLNKSVITDSKGMYDKETADSSQANQTNKMMLWMSPLMSLWIGFSLPCALSLYWAIQGVVSIVQDVILTKYYRKKYDAEDAARLEKYLAEQALEEEKERLRAEKRAANPEGITENTSKKKLIKQQQQAEEAAKEAARKEYAAKKGITDELAEEEAKNQTLSGIADRPYCKGRAYDPNRYSRQSTEE